MQSKKLWWGTMVSIIALSALVLAGCGSKTDLRFRPAVGDTRSVTVRTEAGVAMEIMGQSIDQSSVTNLAFTLEVTGVDAQGVVTIAGTLDDTDLGGVGGMGGMMPGIDSSLGAGDFSMKGATFTMRVTPLGQVEEFSGLSDKVNEMSAKMAAAIKQEMAKSPETAAALAMMGDIEIMCGTMLRRAFGDGAMKEAMADLMTMYADTPLKIGASWPQGIVRSKGMIPYTAHEMWTLRSNDNGTIKLDVAVTTSPNTDAPPMRIGPMSMSHEVSGTGTGTAEVDEATGWLKRADGKHDLEAKMKMTGMPMGQDMTMKIKVDSTITVTPK